MRDLRAGIALVLAWMMAALAAGAPPASPALLVRFVDDRGTAISEPLEVCLVSGLERTCRTIDRDLEPFATAAEQLDSVTVEGSGHGPITVRRRDLKPGEDGAVVLTVPRKARLRVRGIPTTPLSLSLYRSDDPTFRRPAFRVATVGRAPVLVPAGDFVLSLATRGAAPDLHRLKTTPGGEHAAGFRRRAGWSLVLRSVASETRQPLPDTAVEVAAAPGYGVGAPLAARTDSAGLALMSGVTAPLATARLARPGWTERREPALSASPGTFAFREAPLERSGSLRAVITRDGAPAAGADCQIRSFDPAAEPGTQQERWRTVFTGTADARGICRAAGLASGSYSLRARPTGVGTADAAAVRTVGIEPGREVEVHLDLRSIVLEGSVLEGERPAMGYRVEISTLGSGGSSAEPSVATATDDEGRFRVLLWSAGEHFLTLKDGSGNTALFERVLVEEPQTTVDLQLAAEKVAGMVTDREGRPIPGAFVGVRWRKHRLWRVTAGQDGRFACPVEAGGGAIELSASAPGYHPSEPLGLEVPASGAPPPAVLVLERKSEITGVLRSAAGLPVGGAWVASYDVGPDGMPWKLGAATTDADGRFAVPVSKNGPTRLFVTGPGCPLSAHVAPAESRSSSLSCAGAPANLEMTLKDEQGSPIGQEVVSVRNGPLVVPREVLTAHLARLGLPAATDGAGRLALPAMAPGEYELYLGSGSSPMTIAAGLPHGHLGGASLAPLTTTELEITVRPSGP